MQRGAVRVRMVRNRSALWAVFDERQLLVEGSKAAVQWRKELFLALQYGPVTARTTRATLGLFCKAGEAFVAAAGTLC